jgi:catechol 2,3-dioxygenase-like lactoylglutathione lyase family enzyme
MEQRITLITLGVSDLARSKTFYEALGWRGQEVEETVFFQAGGLGFVLWGRAELAADCGLEPGEPGEKVAGGGFGGIALAHNVRSDAEADELLAAAERAGGTITEPAAVNAVGFQAPSSIRTATRGRSRTTPGSRWPRTARSPSPASAASSDRPAPWSARVS